MSCSSMCLWRQERDSGQKSGHANIDGLAGGWRALTADGGPAVWAVRRKRSREWDTRESQTVMPSEEGKLILSPSAQPRVKIHRVCVK